MGIKNLWQLLSPVGRSVSIETLAGKTLAVDVSIWLTQFIKAMRDDDGKVMKNAHIIGTLRRVVKLLFHRIRPVFVFDGGAPALKGRTLAARRKLRSEGTDSSVRKTAQRILASQLKKHKNAINAAKRAASQPTAAVFIPVYQNPDGGIPPAAVTPAAAAAAAVPTATSDEEAVEAGAGKVVAEGGSQDGDNDDDDDDDDGVDWEEQEVDRGDGGRALGAGRRAVVDSDGDEVWQANDTPAARGAGGAAAGAAASAGAAAGTGAGGDDEPAAWAVDTDEEDEDGSVGWEEVELPERNEDIDPEVIASLPDHVKKQVIEAAKRRQRMRSRAQYMPVAGNPAMYSQTQLSNFLRAKQLNSQILKAQTQHDGDKDGKRIASEAGRRYIMTAAGTSGGVGGSRGSGAPRKESPATGSLNKRRRRITDDGDDFKAWTYAPGSGGGAGADKNGGDDASATSRPKPSGATGATAGGGAAGGAKKAGRRDKEEEEEDDDDEEGGGFLPASDDEHDPPVLVAAAAAAVAAGKGKSTASGVDRAAESEDSDGGGGDDDGDDDDDDAGDGGGGFLAPSEEEEEEEEAAGDSSHHEQALGRTRKGKGRARGKSPLSAMRPKPIGHDLHRGGAGRGGKGKRRLQRVGDTADFEGEKEEEEEEERANPEEGNRPPSAQQASESESADAVAKMFQEEEDRRAALAVHSGMDSSIAAAAAFTDDSGDGGRGGDAADGAGGDSLDPLGLLTSRSRRRAPGSSGGVIAPGGDGDAGDKRAVHGDAPSEVFAGGGGGGGGGSGGDGSSAEGAGLGDSAEIELEIDLKDLESGGGRPALMSLLSSAADGAGMAGRAGAVEEEGSDEDFDGFVDDDGGGEGWEDEDEGGPERARALSTGSGQATSVTNEEALQRSVDMASRMAGWAGRVVERVLKEHRQPAAAASASFRNARSNSSSTAATTHTRPPFDPVRSGPAASGVGGHAAAQAASKERRLLEENADGAASGGTASRPVSGSSESLLPPSSGLREGRQERRSGLGTMGGAATAATAGETDKFAGATFPHPVEPSDAAATDKNSSVSGDGVTAAVSSASAGSKGSEVDGAGGPGAAAAAVPEVRVERREMKGGVYSADGDGTSIARGENPAAGGAGDSATAAVQASGGRAVEKEEDHPNDDVSREWGRGAVAGLPLTASKASSSTARSSAIAGGEGRETAAAAAAAAARPGDGNGGEGNTAKVVRTGQEEKEEQDADPAADRKPASAPRAAEGKSGDVVPPLHRVGDLADAAASGTAALFQPSLVPANDSSRLLAASASAGAAVDRVGISHGAIEAAAAAAAAPAPGQEEGGFFGGGGGGGQGLMSSSYLGDMDEDELAQESDRLKLESNRAQRDAETVTDEMKEEVMELLKLCGVPYVVAPMEAEAQCCMLEQLRLVDGTVTDDSDAFAFGGRAVYKNIFNERKYVEAYLLPDAEKDLGVGTDEVIALALLLGSDYTEGVRGVGIVNAMEVINAFPLEGKGAYHGLDKFKKWIDGFDPLLDQELEELTKRGSKKEIEELSLEMKFHLKHKTARNRWAVPEGFPSKEVINAYNNPQVDKSEEPFSWASPDIDGLRALCQRVLGWDQAQSDGLLMPMVKELDKAGFSQPRIDRYFMSYHDNKRVAAIKSKRLRTAVEDLANGPTEVITVDDSSAGKGRGKGSTTPKAKKRKAAAAKKSPSTAGAVAPPPKKKRGNASKSDEEDGDDDDDDDGAPSAETRRRRTAGSSSQPADKAGDDSPDTSSSSPPPPPPVDDSSKQPTASSASTSASAEAPRAKRTRRSATPSGGGGGGHRSTRNKKTAAPADNSAAASASSRGSGRGTAGKRATRQAKGRGGGEADAAAAAAASSDGKRRNPRRSAAAASSGGAVDGNGGDALFLGGEEDGSSGVDGEDGGDEDDDAEYSGGSSGEGSSDDEESVGVSSRSGMRKTRVRRK